MTDNNDEIRRTEGGQIVPGSGAQLGKTSSRRLGTGEAAKLRKLIEPERDAIVMKLIETAKGGTKEAVRAAEVLLSRLAAPPKATAELVHIEGLAAETTLEGKCQAVVIAVARGKVSATAGREILSMLHVYGRARQLDEFEARLRALEQGRRAPIDITPEPEVPLV